MAQSYAQIPLFDFIGNFIRGGDDSVHPAAAFTLRADEPQPFHRGLVGYARCILEWGQATKSVVRSVDAGAEILGGDDDAHAGVFAQPGQVFLGAGDQPVSISLFAVFPGGVFQLVRANGIDGDCVHARRGHLG